jgi:hypothetical protein
VPPRDSYSRAWSAPHGAASKCGARTTRGKPRRSPARAAPVRSPIVVAICFSTWRSSARSATSRFSRAFSRSSAFRRSASRSAIPSYFGATDRISPLTRSAARDLRQWRRHRLLVVRLPVPQQLDDLLLALSTLPHPSARRRSEGLCDVIRPEKRGAEHSQAAPSFARLRPDVDSPAQTRCYRPLLRAATKRCEGVTRRNFRVDRNNIRRYARRVAAPLSGLHVRRRFGLAGACSA